MKMYNVGQGIGDQLHVPTIKKLCDDGIAREYVKVPVIFGADQFVEHKPGNVYVPIDGVGFFTVPRGKYLEVPPGISVAAVKGLAPHLVSEDEYMMSKQADAKPDPEIATDEETKGDEPVTAEKPRRGRPPQS